VSPAALETRRAREGPAQRAAPACSRRQASHVRTRRSTTDGDFWAADASGASATTFSDASWAAVTLPHTWNALDGQDGGSYYRGVGWYRRHVTPTASAAGKRMFLQFDGAGMAATIYVNGVMVGKHRGGFARFRFDVTGMMTPGTDNVVAVQVSNASAPDLPPLSGDFTFFGGLYRDVHLLVTDNVHVDALDYGASGVYVDTPSVSATSATVRARVRVRNDSAAAQPVTVDSLTPSSSRGRRCPPSPAAHRSRVARRNPSSRSASPGRRGRRAARASFALAE